MDYKEVHNLKSVDSTIKRLYIESVNDLARKGIPDSRFTLVLSETDLRRLDYFATLLRQKRVALARELLIAALSDAEKLLDYDGWEYIPEGQLIDTKAAAHNAEAKVLYASVIKGKLKLEIDDILAWQEEDNDH